MSMSQANLDDLAARLLASNEKMPLTKQEQDAVREMLVAWALWKSFGRVGKVLIWVLMTLAGIVITYNQLREGVAKWYVG